MRTRVLARNLAVGPGHRVPAIGAPAGVREGLADLPDGVGDGATDFRNGVLEGLADLPDGARLVDADGTA